MGITVSAVVEILKRAWPYLAALLAGFAIAWQIQALRVTAVELDFKAYQQMIKEGDLVYREAAQTLRELDAVKFQESKIELEKQIEAGDVYRRCVAAGKCGMRQPVACSPSIRLPPASGADAAGADPISVIPGPAAEGIDEVVNDCAITTLMLNRLQESIEGQVGY